MCSFTSKGYIKINIVELSENVQLIQRLYYVSGNLGSLRTEHITRKKLCIWAAKIKVKNDVTNHQPFTKSVFLSAVRCSFCMVEAQQIFE